MVYHAMTTCFMQDIYSCHHSVQLTTEASLIKFIDALKVDTFIVSIDLGSFPITFRAMWAIASMIRVNSTVTDIQLYGCKLDNAAIITFSKALKHNCTIKSIDVSNNVFFNDGISAIADALTFHSSVTDIDVTDSVIFPATLNSLGRSLRVNSTLTHIRVSYFDHEMINHLRVNTSVHTFVTKQEPIGPHHVDLLVNVLTDNMSLTTVEMGGPRFDVRIGGLVRILKHHPSFQQFDGPKWRSDIRSVFYALDEVLRENVQKSTGWNMMIENIVCWI